VSPAVRRQASQGLCMLLSLDVSSWRRLRRVERRPPRLVDKDGACHAPRPAQPSLFSHCSTRLLQWAWSYVTWHRGARLITGVECRDSLGRPPVTFGTANRREDEQPPCPKGDEHPMTASLSSDDHLRSHHHEHSCRMCAPPGPDGDDRARADRRACRRAGTRCRGTQRGTPGGDHRRAAAGNRRRSRRTTT